MEAYQVRVKKTLQEVLAFVELVEDCRCRESLVEVKANICLLFTNLLASDIVWS